VLSFSSFLVCNFAYKRRVDDAMDIETFLSKQIKPGENFTAGLASLDFIGSSGLSGTPQEIADTKKGFLELVTSLIEKHPIAILNWPGDGGLLICDGARGFDELVILCDQIIGLLPFFNRSFGRYTFLNEDRIHVRIVCNSAFVKNTGSAETFTAELVDKTAKYERNIGIRDHIVVTSEIHKGLSEDLQKRLALQPAPDKELGFYHVLDSLESLSVIKRNTGTSEQIRNWIAAAVRHKKYNEIMIFTYTNESLYEYLSTPLPGIHIRVLARNWIKEAEEENAYNLRISQSTDKAEASKTSDLLRLWKKADVIKRDAEVLIDEDHEHPYDNIFNIKFYDSKPFLKGIILRNSETKRRIGYIGHYAWDFDWQSGGSPIIGEDWSAVWLSEDGGSQSNMLDAITSRFEQTWEQAKNFSELRELEREKALTDEHKRNVKAVWELYGQKFLIIIPGRKQRNRIYPLVGAEDLLATRSVENFLREHSVDFELKILTKGNSNEISKNWKGNIVYICHRSISPKFFNQIKKKGFPFDLLATKGERPSIVNKDLDQQFFSPMDARPPKESDFCLVAKARRPDGEGSIFIIAGLHGMGTLAGAQYLTSEKQLEMLFQTRKNADFASVIQCEFREHWEILGIKNITFPEGLEDLET
jgi:hypothetical protein